MTGMVTTDTNSDTLSQYSYIYNHLVKLSGQHITEACRCTHRHLVTLILHESTITSATAIIKGST